MPEKSEVQRLADSINAFNDFFSDLRLLFEKIGKRLRSSFPLDKFVYYYRKPEYQPQLPQFYMVALGGPEFAVQMYAVLDPALLEDQPALRAEPSIIVLVHPHGSKAGYAKDYGQRLMSNDRILIDPASAVHPPSDGMLTGSLSSRENIPFLAMQLSFEKLSAQPDLNAVFDTLIPEITSYRQRLGKTAASMGEP